MKHILLTERQVKRYIRSLILEDTREKQAKRIVMNALEGTGKDPDKVLYDLRHAFGLMGNRGLSYLPTVAAAAVGELGFGRDDADDRNLNLLKRILRLVMGSGNPEYTAAFRGADFKTITERFGNPLSQADREEEQALGAASFQGGSDYEVISDVDFGAAKRYGAMSCRSSRLCYTGDKGTWNGYTKNGLNKVYLLLRKGWEDEPEEHGEPRSDIYEGFTTNAYDNYGLSMIFVFVDPEGNISNSNTRWNHRAEYGGKYDVDTAFDKMGLSVLIGQRFDEVFMGYTKEELRSRGVKYIGFDDVPSLLAQGADPEEVFDSMEPMGKGWTRVRLNGKCNAINANGQLVSGEWLRDMGKFHDGFARVQRANGLHNFINTDGRVISDEWFRLVGDFYGGFAAVQGSNGFLNFINTDGRVISDEWFKSTWGFYEGLAAVKRADGLWNFINTDGRVISDEWFSNAWNFHEGFARVQRADGLWNFINTDGRVISDEWFWTVRGFVNGFALVQRVDDTYGYIDGEGNLYDEQKNMIRQNNRNMVNEFYDLLGRIK